MIKGISCKIKYQRVGIYPIKINILKEIFDAA